MKSESEKMAALLRELKVEMNGAVAGSMQERGVTYPLNYGVSVPTIRKAVAGFAPDHKLARLLYRQQVRELRLAGIMAADPAEVATDRAEFWAEGVINTEVAEHLAMTLLPRSAIAWDVFDSWLNSGDSLLVYCALLTAARRVKLDGRSPRPEFDEVAERLYGALGSPERYVWQGVARLLESVVQVEPHCVGGVRGFVRRVTDAAMPCAEYLAEELGWQLED